MLSRSGKLFIWVNLKKFHTCSKSTQLQSFQKGKKKKLNHFRALLKSSKLGINKHCLKKLK